MTSHLARRVGASILLLALVVLPPIGIAALIGRPYPQWDTIRDQLDSGQVSTDTVMRIAAALFIAVWIWMIATITGEVFRISNAQHSAASNGRRNHTIEPARGGRAMLHRLVRLALLGTVTTAVTVSTWSTLAIANSPNQADNTRPATPTGAPQDPVDTVPSPPAITTIVANGRSTPLSIAVDLGDENLRDDIVTMNQSSEWSNGVFPAGMLVTVPLTTGADTVAPAVPVTRYVVQDNDGLWNVAEALLGDGARYPELRAQLIGQQVTPGVVFTETTEVIHPGWIFEYPDTAPTTPADPVMYRVRDDDSLSRIAERELGDPDRWVEIWDLNAQATMNDGRVFDDPNLIRAGWDLLLTPPTPTDVTLDDVTVAEQATPTAPALPEQSAPAPASTAPPATPVDSSPHGELSSPTEPHETLSTATATATATAKAKVAQANADPDARPNGPPRAAAADIWTTVDRSVWTAITVGALLTAGLAATIRRLRNRRLRHLQPGHRLEEPSSVAAGTELAITRAADEPAHSTMLGLLRSLTPYVAEQADPPIVRAVQIGIERVEVLFTTPAPMPPHGWVTVDGGQSWTHRFDDDVTESRQLLTPALVTIGVRTDDTCDEVLLDLETAGSLTIVGHREPALGVARSIALELATYPLGVPMDVCLIGVHVDGTELCDRVWGDTTMTRAVRVAQQRLDRLGTQGATSMVTARAGLAEDDGAHDPQVFIIDTANLASDDVEMLDELIRLCQPACGTVAVIVGDHSGAGERITVDGTGHADWSGVDLHPPNVTRQAAAEIAVTLDHVANADSEPITPTEITLAQSDVVPLDADGDDPDDGPDAFVYQPPPHDIVVQVMGNVRAHGIDLTADETELLALLTCLRHRTEIHVELINDAIAPERARKTIENRVSRMRGSLGVGTDGLDLLPEAMSGRRGQSHYLISPLVVTDVDLLEHRYHTAHTLPSSDAFVVMRDGLDLMRGPLFRARRGYDGWPHSEGVVVAMTAIIQAYATRLIELAVDVDDVALVIRTTATAGRVLDNPLSEFPMRQAARAYAEACGDDELLASVAAAQQRFIEYTDTYDTLVDG